MKLNEIVTELKSLQSVISRDLSYVDAKFRPSLEMQANQAKDKHAKLAAQYAEQILGNSKLFVLNGDLAKCVEFASLAKEHASCFHLSADSLYDEVVKPTSIYHGQQAAAGNHGLIELCTMLQSVAHRYNEPVYAKVDSKYMVGIDTPEKRRALVKTFVADNTSVTLWGKYFNERLVAQALRELFELDTVPVVVTGFDEDEFVKIFKNNPNATLINISNRKIDKAYVYAVLNEMKSRIKAKAETNEVNEKDNSND